jgi:hypothetical protein
MAKPKEPKLSKEEKKAMKKEYESLRTEAVDFAADLIDSWTKGAKKRLDKIREIELSYNGEVRPSLKGRSNFPFPVLPKYVDELQGRLDELPAFKIGPWGRNALLLVARKLQAAIDKFKKPTSGDWARQDRMGRTFSIFSGYCAFDFYTEVNEDGELKGHARPIDHNDFVFDFLAGNDLEQHRGVGEFPLIRSEGQIMERVEMGLYDKQMAERLIKNSANTNTAQYSEALQGRYARYKALGIDIQNTDSKGSKMFALAQMQITLQSAVAPEKSGRYLITFDYQTRIPLRFEKLTDVYKAGKGMYSIDLYQTHETPNSVMCKAPVDDIYAIAEGMRLKVNQIFDASTKQLWGQTVYDPNFFPDPSQLEWRRPDQLIVGRAHNNRPVSEGLHQIKTDFNYDGNVGFVKYLDQFLAGVVGINPNDVSEETKRVGVMFGQLQKTAARLGVQNKSYAEMWARGIMRIVMGMKDNMTEPMMVKLIGTKGAEWEELSKEELTTPEDYEIIVEGSTVEAELNEAMKQDRQKALAAITSDPDLKKEVSPRWLVENILKTGRYDEEEIRRALDAKNYGSEESVARADLAIEKILKGKEPHPYQGADLAFVSYILDFAMKMADDDKGTEEERIAILNYGRSHMPIVIRNEAAKTAIMTAGMPDSVGANIPLKAPDGGAPPVPPEAANMPPAGGAPIPTPPIPNGAAAAGVGA